MRRAAISWAAALLLAACGDVPPIPDADALLRITVAAEEVAPGQGLPIEVVRVWQRDLEPSPWDDAVLAPLSVVHESTTRRTDDEHVEEIRRYRGYAFTLKDATIPAVAFGVRGADGGAARLTRSEPVRLRVRPTLDPEDPGPPEGPGAPPDDGDAEWILRLLAVLMAVAAAVVVGVVESRRPRDVRALPTTPAARALAALEALRARPVGDPEALRVHAGALADVVRDFVEGAYGIRARRRTTPEVLAALPGVRAILADLLQPGDLAKYAGLVPDRAGRDDLLDRAEDFVRSAGVGRST